jgi:hypothetical protein
MRSQAFIAIGALLVLTGVLWFAQGVGWVGGSVMSGDLTWAIIGPIVAVVGIALILAGRRGRPSS